MKIEVEIKAPELASALSDIAIALSAMANLSGGTALPSTVETTAETTAGPLKGSDLKKHQISEEIVALGGTPPEKGSVAKFEAALEEAKKAAAGGGGTDDGEDVSLDDVRTLAHAVIKSTPDNPATGKAALGGCLKTVKAKNLTDATPAQLNKIVPMLEEYIGKTLAEVLAEAE